MIKIVFIDVDNTLLDFDKCAELSIKQAFADFGLSFSNEVVEAFHKINEGLWHEIEKGKITRAELFDVRWNKILEYLGIKFDGHVLEKRFFSYLTKAAVPVDHALETLRYLSEKYIICITSNAGHDQQTKRLESVGMLGYIDKVFVSERIGFAKPDKSFFDACFREIDGVLPEETIIIGDSLTADVEGGKKYGMKTCWYNHKKIEHPQNSNADYIVDFLPDIKNFL